MDDRGIVGRESELAVVAEFLDDVASGARALLLEGDAGIGKTSLLDEAVRQARSLGFTVLACRGTAAEARLSFAGLGDLLQTVPDEALGALPSPQRHALDVALVRTAPGDRPPEQRALGLAVLGVVAALAGDTPLLVAVDDAQWLDPGTVSTLEFVARRLDADRVGLLAAARTTRASTRTFVGCVEPVRRTTLQLGPLNLAALHRIVLRHLGTPLARPRLRRVELASGGNPFYALELARTVLAEGETRSAASQLPLPDDLRDLVVSRIARLSRATRKVLLEAAALTAPSLAIVDGKPLGPAERAGIVEVDDEGSIVFTHPLLALGAYRAATTTERRAAHRRLAERVDGVEERARHLALGADGPDRIVAAALSAAARDASRRGAREAAAELASLARRLTPPELDDDVHERAFEQARYAASAGDPRGAIEILHSLDTGAVPDRIRARALALLGRLVETSDGAEVATVLCERALAVAGSGDAALRSHVHELASRVCDHDVARKQAHAQAALELARLCPDEPLLEAEALLAVAEADFYAGGGIREELFVRAAELEDAPTQLVSESDHLLAMLLVHADELERGRSLLERELRVATEVGDEGQVGRVLGRLATIELRSGSWDLAAARVDEMEEVIVRTGQDVSENWRLTLCALLHALRGDVGAARADAVAALALAGEDAVRRWQQVEGLVTRGLVELYAGTPEGARAPLLEAEQLVQAIGLRDPGIFRYQPALVEALVATGELDDAETRLRDLEQRAQELDRPWLRATAARTRGLLHAARGDLADAEAELERALVEHGRVSMPFEEAVTLLCLGRVQRRAKQRRAARESLSRALEIFTRLGAAGFVERVRHDVARLGGRQTPDGLTAGEQAVAELAASGATNQEIATRLFMSRRTVEANLARVYRKLQIGSRAELGAWMATVNAPLATKRAARRP